MIPLRPARPTKRVASAHLRKLFARTENFSRTAQPPAISPPPIGRLPHKLCLQRPAADCNARGWPAPAAGRKANRAGDSCPCPGILCARTCTPAPVRYTPTCVFSRFPGDRELFFLPARRTVLPTRRARYFVRDRRARVTSAA